jgi:hypothetical protein
MDENTLRAKALEFLDGQHIQDQQFYDAIRDYMAEIPVSRVGLPYCKTCESALCGICGQCHELDHEILFVGLHCPVAVETHGMSPCVAWSWAYIFLRRAEKALSI